MKQRSWKQWGLAWFALATTSFSALAAQVLVEGPEDWDGVNNPHEADGVTLSGSGSVEDPAVYTIPEGMHITATGVVQMPPVADELADRTIQFLFASGNLEMDEGAVINVGRRNRNDREDFLLDMGGGDIVGSGRIIGLLVPADSPRITTIRNVNDVHLQAVDLHVSNANSGGRHFTVEAAGRVVIGSVDNSDQDAGGGSAPNVTISASSIEVGDVDVRAMRTGGQAANGNVVLKALAPPAYDAAAADNQFGNSLILKGIIRTAGAGGIGGNIALAGVRTVLYPGFAVSKSDGGTFAFDTGVLNDGVVASDVFFNMSESAVSPANSVQWSGAGPAGSPPKFSSALVVLPAGQPNADYSGSLAGQASDPDNDALSFLRGSGPEWLNVAPDGSLSGVPLDSGINTFRIFVTDGTRFAEAALRIPISGRPSFFNDPVLKPRGLQGQAYNDTLADAAADPDNDPLTFAKLDGPSWLTVAPDGKLSGTPTSSDTFTNAWTVSVSDGTGSGTATLIIVVGGAPRFFANPTTKPPAHSGIDYGVLAATLAVDAADPEGEPILFSKVSGPAWLQVGSDGALSGTPAPGDAGGNSWVVRASDGTFSSEATLSIDVLAGDTPVVITESENWDGVSNPHAGEGVTLTGGGTPADPAIYNIPAGMTMEPGGAIHMSPVLGADRSITFQFGSGDFHMQEGAVINVGRRNRAGQQNFVLDLGGGSITGGGKIVGTELTDDSPRVVTIQNINDVTMAEIDLHVVNANNAGRHLTITAAGKVTIGKVDNSDQDRGGNNSSNIDIRAAAIEVGDLDVRAMRADGQSLNGKITLIALAPPTYDGSLPDNVFANQLTLTGSLQTAGAGTRGGDVTLRGVVVHLGSGFTYSVPEAILPLIEAGVPQNEATESDLFIDEPGVGLTASHVVQWSGDLVPTMSISRDGANVVISWNGSGYVLQETSNLLDPASWANVAGAPASPATLPASGAGGKFFRVAK